MKKPSRKFFFLMLLTCIVASSYIAYTQDRRPRIPNLKGMKIAVITDSISCSRLARVVMRRNSATESSLKEADVILTVVRSSLNHPLNSSYESTRELKEDIESQLNISGSNGHIYVYRIDNDLSTREIFHSGFEWTDDIDDL